ncbi:hypothetical protein [Sebaldella sp. S0638]|uniref:hypothetical protein n=1 Tax=Sebaldella sp. S0638 TaxID=2957809 RepID=UPI0020A205C6|nr:hypothetical protein [Sebaldella sp. S0638]MCP1226637.1 hypothetical protein [Sebaldella sp. S0638]
MTLKKIYELIDKEIDKKYKFQKDFCREKGIDYRTYKTTLSRVLERGKDVQYSTVRNTLKAIGYDIKIVKLDE